jgi:hypothetical protein
MSDGPLAAPGIEIEREALAGLARSGARAAAVSFARIAGLPPLTREEAAATVSRSEEIRDGERGAIAAVFAMASGGACAIGFDLEGEARGMLAVVYTAEESSRLLQQLASRAGASSREAFESAGRSALREIANILAGAFVSAIAAETGARLVIAAPRTLPRIPAGSMLGAIVAEILLPAPGLSCRLLLVPKPGGMDKLIAPSR